MIVKNKLTAQANSRRETAADEKINSAKISTLQDRQRTTGLHNIEEFFQIIFNNSTSNLEAWRKK